MTLFPGLGRVECSAPVPSDAEGAFLAAGGKERCRGCNGSGRQQRGETLPEVEWLPAPPGKTEYCGKEYRKCEACGGGGLINAVS